MLLLHYLENVERPDGSTPTEAEGRAFRLFVKERLYRFNYVCISIRRTTLPGAFADASLLPTPRLHPGADPAGGPRGTDRKACGDV